MLHLLPYHENATRYFQQQTPVWEFFSNHRHKEEQLKEFKTDLLKNTYKFDEAADPALYEKVQQAKEKLGLSLPVILYQAQHTEEINASVIYLQNEVHIVFSGRLISMLSDEELLAVIAHELSHVLLYTQQQGGVEVADRIVTAMANNPGSNPAQYETARLFKLYTEIFCDRGAYLVTDNYAPIISSLVKIATGLQTVNADSYIKQAEEIFANDAATKTNGISHPENFIRARAIWLWHNKKMDAAADIRKMIEGHVSIDELDLFKQQELNALTKQVLEILCHPEWMRTAHITALAQQYFPGLQTRGDVDTAQLAGQIEPLHQNLKDYLAYVLYDFTTADKTLEEVPLGYCFYLADVLKLDKAFASAVKKEHRLTDKKTGTRKMQALAAYHELSLQNR